MSHNFSNVMINSTSTNEAHYTLLTHIYKQPQFVRNTTLFLASGPKKTSLLQHSNKALRSSQQQHELLHRRGRLGELPTSNPTIRRGRAGLSNDPRHQKVSPSKLSSNRYSPGWRHFRPLGTHHFRCSLIQHCSSNSRVTNILVITKRPRAGTSINGWNSSPTQRSSPNLGRRCADLPDMHLRPASIEEANHWSLRANVLGDLERQHGGLRHHFSKRYVGPSLGDLWQHHISRLGDQLRAHASGMGSPATS
jgi:hypothetical protein